MIGGVSGQGAVIVDVCGLLALFLVFGIASSNFAPVPQVSSPSGPPPAAQVMARVDTSRVHLAHPALSPRACAATGVADLSRAVEERLHGQVPPLLAAAPLHTNLIVCMLARISIAFSATAEHCLRAPLTKFPQADGSRYAGDWA